MSRRYVCKPHGLVFKTYQDILTHMKEEHPFWYEYFKDKYDDLVMVVIS